MNCYFHPQAEGVVSCGKCGVAMCKECEANVDFESSWLKKRMVKLIFCSIFVVIGLFALLIYNSSGDMGTGVFYAIILWAISGAIANIRNKKNNDSVKNQVWNAAYEYNHPFMSMIIGIIVNAIFGPILLITHFIGYARTKAQYNKDLQDLETIKAAVNQ